MRILHKVLGRVGDVCVKGVGTWEPAWIHTRKANDAFDLAFDEWVAGDDKTTRRKLVETSDLFVEAWEVASTAYTTDLLKREVEKQTQAEGF